MYFSERCRRCWLDFFVFHRLPTEFHQFSCAAHTFIFYVALCLARLRSPLHYVRSSCSTSFSRFAAVRCVCAYSPVHVYIVAMRMCWCTTQPSYKPLENPMRPCKTPSLSRLSLSSMYLSTRITNSHSLLLCTLLSLSPHFIHTAALSFTHSSPFAYSTFRSDSFQFFSLSHRIYFARSPHKMYFAQLGHTDT